MKKTKHAPAKPFLKWAGGKSQLLKQFQSCFPVELAEGKIRKYFEPFIGGGAVFFEVVQNFGISSAYLSDINEELIIPYRVLQKDVEDLIDILGRFERQYKNLNEEKRKQYFYDLRDHYNQKRFDINYHRYSQEWVPRAAQMIFLNRTCYNGLFRVNRAGEFNVPFGSYKNPSILDADNLLNVSGVLQKSEIRTADFEAFGKNVDSQSFVYFDPPYRPISQTSSFTAYSKHVFDDIQQQRLGHFFRKLDAKKARLMLSNSDPANHDPDDDFFYQLYKDYRIQKVAASRMINSKASKRGEINELVITNY